MPDSTYTSKSSKNKFTGIEQVIDQKLHQIVELFGIDVNFLFLDHHAGNGVNLVDGVDVGSSSFIAYHAIKKYGLTNWKIRSIERNKLWRNQLINRMTVLAEKDKEIAGRWLSYESDNKEVLKLTSDLSCDSHGILFHDPPGQLQHLAVLASADHYKNMDLLMYINERGYKGGPYDGSKKQRVSLHKQLNLELRKHWFITRNLKAGEAGCKRHLMYGTNHENVLGDLDGTVYHSFEDTLGAMIYEDVAYLPSELVEA